MFLKDLVVQLNGLISYIIETHIFLSSFGLVFQNAKSVEYLLQANPKSVSVSEEKNEEEKFWSNSFPSLFSRKLIQIGS